MSLMHLLQDVESVVSHPTRCPPGCPVRSNPDTKASGTRTWQTLPPRPSPRTPPSPCASRCARCARRFLSGLGSFAVGTAVAAAAATAGCRLPFTFALSRLATEDGPPPPARGVLSRLLTSDQRGVLAPTEPPPRPWSPERGAAHRSAAAKLPRGGRDAVGRGHRRR